MASWTPGVAGVGPSAAMGWALGRDAWSRVVAAICVDDPRYRHVLANLRLACRGLMDIVDEETTCIKVCAGVYGLGCVWTDEGFGEHAGRARPQVRVRDGRETAETPRVMQVGAIKIRR